MANTRSESSRSKRSTSNTGSRGAAQKRAGNSSNTQSSCSATPGADVSAAEMVTYKLVQAWLVAQKKATRQAEDAAIRTRNRQLLEAEDGEDAEESRCASKKKKSAANNILNLSDDEIGMATRLPAINALATEQGTDEEMSADEDGENFHNNEEDEALHADLDGIDVDEVDVEVDMEDSNRDLSNQIIVETGLQEPSVSAVQKGCSKSTVPRTPRPKSQSISAANTSKVVEKNFTPRTLKLALASKSHTIKEVAFESDDIEIRQAYKRATTNTATKGNLMKFTLYGRTGLVSSIISKARDKVRAYYGFNGEPDVVKKDVEWLLKDSHFVYGGIDLKERCVDLMKPFGAQLIIDIIEAQWFPSTSRSKLDLETTNKIFEKRDLPLNVILLVVTAIEHALKEWSTNGRKTCQITFSEDITRLSYERHLSHWQFFESQMKAWPAWWRKTILDQILDNHSNFILNTNDNDFAHLDFSALDRLAGCEEEEVNEGERNAETHEERDARDVDAAQRIQQTSGSSECASSAEGDGRRGSAGETRSVRRTTGRSGEASRGGADARANRPVEPASDGLEHS